MFLQKLVEISYNKAELDAEKIFEIASYLSRKELKIYIRALKEQEKRQTVIVEIPSEEAKKSLAEVQTLFPEKKLQYVANPSILLGARITDNDIVYEMNLRDSLNNMVRYIEEQG
jgi:hypothetical protein